MRSMGLGMRVGLHARLMGLSVWRGCALWFSEGLSLVPQSREVQCGEIWLPSGLQSA